MRGRCCFVRSGGSGRWACCSVCPGAGGLVGSAIAGWRVIVAVWSEIASLTTTTRLIKARNIPVMVRFLNCHKTHPLRRRRRISWRCFGEKALHRRQRSSHSHAHTGTWVKATGTRLVAVLAAASSAQERKSDRSGELGEEGFFPGLHDRKRFDQMATQRAKLQGLAATPA